MLGYSQFADVIGDFDRFLSANHPVGPDRAKYDGGPKGVKCVPRRGSRVIQRVLLISGSVLRALASLLDGTWLRLGLAIRIRYRAAFGGATAVSLHA
jgi:hypothetical protein